jgi:hypothetical protein
VAGTGPRRARAGGGGVGLEAGPGGGGPLADSAGESEVDSEGGVPVARGGPGTETRMGTQARKDAAGTGRAETVTGPAGWPGGGKRSRGPGRRPGRCQWPGPPAGGSDVEGRVWM